MRGWGKKGHCFLPLVSVFRMTHSSLQKTNSPNESGCAVAAPGVSYSAPASSPKPFAGSAPKGAGSRTYSPSLAAPTITPSRSSLLGNGTSELCANPAVTGCSRAGVTALIAVFTPHHGVEKGRCMTLHPEWCCARYQIKRFSKFGWCLEGRRGPGDLMKCLRLGSALAKAVRTSLC